MIPEFEPYRLGRTASMLPTWATKLEAQIGLNCAQNTLYILEQRGIVQFKFVNGALRCNVAETAERLKQYHADREKRESLKKFGGDVVRVPGDGSKPWQE